MRFLLVLCIAFTTVTQGQRIAFSGIDFAKADSLAKHYHGASLTNLPHLTHNLTEGLDTEVEKFRAIYRWVCTNIENDYAAYQRTKKKRKKIKKDQASFLLWNKGYTPKMFQTLVKHKKTACTGYAYLIKEMANLAGLDCEIINGFGKVLNANLGAESEPNHSWNAVRLANTWYLCDATWSAGTFVINEGVPSFKKEYVDGYFLTEPRYFAKNHYPLDTKWLLMPNPLGFEDFLAGPLLYKDAFEMKVFPEEPQKMHVRVQKGRSFVVKFNGEVNLEKALVLFMVYDGNQTTAVVPELQKKDTVYFLREPLNRRGTYDIHLNINGKPIATYVVKVTK